MATIPEPMSPAGAWRAKHVVFAGILLVLAYVLYHNERFLLDFANPEWAHIEPFKWWLLPHGLAGACALLLAPLQFSSRETLGPGVAETVVWVCLAFSLLLADIALQWQELVRSRQLPIVVRHAT